MLQFASGALGTYACLGTSKATPCAGGQPAFDRALYHANKTSGFLGSLVQTCLVGFVVGLFPPAPQTGGPALIVLIFILTVGGVAVSLVQGQLRSQCLLLPGHCRSALESISQPDLGSEGLQTC